MMSVRLFNWATELHQDQSGQGESPAGYGLVIVELCPGSSVRQYQSSQSSRVWRVAGKATSRGFERCGKVVKM